MEEKLSTVGGHFGKLHTIQLILTSLPPYYLYHHINFILQNPKVIIHMKLFRYDMSRESTPSITSKVSWAMGIAYENWLSEFSLCSWWPGFYTSILGLFTCGIFVFFFYHISCSVFVFLHVLVFCWFSRTWSLNSCWSILID